MAIRLPNCAARAFDIFLLCLLRDRSSFVREVVLELSQRGYTVFLPELCEVDSSQRAVRLCHGVSRARLSAAIVGHRLDHAGSQRTRASRSARSGSRLRRQWSNGRPRGDGL
jgi:hypothetical protein